MLYPTLFLIRFFPFWGVPLALVIFELGVYHFNRRTRHFYVPCFLLALFLVIISILWIVYEGYWRWGPAFMHFVQGS